MVSPSLLSRRQFTLSMVTATLAGAVGKPGAAADPIAGAASGRPHDPIPVAVLLDQGAEVIDFAGPWEVFQDAEVADVPGFRLFTVAPRRSPLRATAGLQLVPDFTFGNAPQARVIVIGAQGGHDDDPEKLAWIRSAAEKADVILSVCTGAFALARTGLIDGMRATTHHDFYDPFQKRFPKVRLVRGRRFVDNGKFITAGGLTSGVDGALHVVSRFYGQAAAERTARYMEHDGTGWQSGDR
jgi:transcriptional regulator GlxA family with amidase domain